MRPTQGLPSALPTITLPSTGQGRVWNALLATLRLTGLCGLLTTATLPATLPAVAAQDKEHTAAKISTQDLQNVRSRIQSVSKDLNKTRQDKSSVTVQLKSTQTALSATERKLAELNARQDKVQNEVDALERQRDSLTSQISQQQEQLADMLAQRYRQGESTPLQATLSGNNLHDTARDQYLFSRLTHASAKQVPQLRGTLAEKTRLAEARRIKMNELEEIAKQQAQVKKTLLLEQKSKQKSLITLDNKLSEQNRTLATLKADEARLTRVIEEIARRVAAAAAEAAERRAREKARAELAAKQEKERLAAQSRSNKKDSPTSTKPRKNNTVVETISVDKSGLRQRIESVPESAAEPDGGAFAALRGRLKLPTRGEIISRFGKPRSDGGTTWKGTFIRTSIGAEVRAVAAGRVVYADALRGFGNLLILDHGSGYLTIYGNNQAIYRQNGQSVKTGDIIAVTGSSDGSGESGLYFELRQRGQPVDPMSWASAR